MIGQFTRASPHQPALGFGLILRPRDVAMLAPLVKKEILWRLVTGEQGAAVRQLGLADSGLTHIARVVQWVREHYARAFQVEELARLAGMSASAFHRSLSQFSREYRRQFGVPPSRDAARPAVDQRAKNSIMSSRVGL
ncbi:AraC family transcriptional regulator N-terminal domain-containing protein [Actinoplanes sp. NPDC000266]